MKQLTKPKYNQKDAIGCLNTILCREYGVISYEFALWLYMSQMDDQLKDESVSQGSPNGYDQQTIQQTVQQSHGTRRNIRIGRRRTSVKLEPAMWDALIDITVRTNKSINQICTEVHNAGAGPNRAETAGANFTSELRVFILDYYRAIAR